MTDKLITEPSRWDILPGSANVVDQRAPSALHSFLNNLFAPREWMPWASPTVINDMPEPPFGGIHSTFTPKPALPLAPGISSLADAAGYGAIVPGLLSQQQPSPAPIGGLLQPTPSLPFQQRWWPFGLQQ